MKNQAAIKTVLLHALHGRRGNYEHVFNDLCSGVLNIDKEVHLLMAKQIAMDDLSGVALQDAKDLIEYELLRRCLKKNDWNKTQVGRELGISRTTVLKKIDKYSHLFWPK